MYCMIISGMIKRLCGYFLNFQVHYLDLISAQIRYNGFGTRKILNSTLLDVNNKLGTEHINVTLRHVHITIFVMESQSVFHILSELSSMQYECACLVLQYFSPLSHKRHDFQKKLLNTESVF
jgi:hypothetical protein